MTTFTFEPTGYELARAKQAAQTPAQRKREGRKQLAIALRRLDFLKLTPVSNYETLLKARQICQEYDLEIPILVKWLILMMSQ